jgi:nucleotide-binding universal stress UspA family protein
MHESDSPPSVIVGIDGSPAAIGAALWGVDEAVARDVPLRLVYAIDPREPIHRDADSFAHRLATAESAVRYALVAVEASQQPVKIEIEIVHGDPVATLIRASRSAEMLCVGASRHYNLTRVGSTALALTENARCPVAVLRGYADVVRGSGGWIAVELDQSPMNDEVVERAVDEARLRDAQLQVLTRCQSAEDARDYLDPRLTALIARNPDTDIRPVAVTGSVVDYLDEHISSVKLVVVGTGGNVNLLGDTDCPLLLVRGTSQRQVARATSAE